MFAWLKLVAAFPNFDPMSLILTNDGSHTIFSERHGSTYHSKHGAVAESGHVYIDAGLLFSASRLQEIRILEAGFGTGLNAFMTMLEAEKRHLPVQYLGLETEPLEWETASALNYPEVLGVPERVGDFHFLHQSVWDVEYLLSPHFHFEKRSTPIEAFVAENGYDLIYFDAFAPQDQPELWTEAVFQRMYHSLRPGGALLTYCAQSVFKKMLKSVGFEVQRLPGPYGKMEITRAIKTWH